MYTRYTLILFYSPIFLSSYSQIPLSISRKYGFPIPSILLLLQKSLSFFYKKNDAIFDLLDLIYFTQHLVYKVHLLSTSDSHLSFFKGEQYLTIHTWHICSIHSSVERYILYFYNLAITKFTGMNVGMHGPLQYQTFRDQEVGMHGLLQGQTLGKNPVVK